LVDTNIILYLLGGDKTIIPILENKNLFISFISELELLSYINLTNKELSVVKNFLSECSILDINSKIKEHAIEIKRKYKLKLPDTIVLATSQYLNIQILSADNQFNQVKEIDLIYYKK
ncbi:MAG TPA: type II toxin-antitoxin system VapC family toxin, partial [Ignavibacteriaceae bacterium]|nr:type II toxin-antitoxin system VapC family toxin [Ignavibacteriaceae bacterium]